MTQEFRLIIPAKVDSEFLGGWAAGSINAHYFHYLRNRKVFWSQHFVKKGFGIYKKEVKKNWNNIRFDLGKPYGDILVSNIGYFYKTGTGNITWQYKLEKIIHKSEIAPEEIKYIPSFRKIYYDDPMGHDRCWFLISEMKKLRTPVNCLKSDDFGFLNKQGSVPITGSHLRRNCFANKFPIIDEDDLIEPDLEELKDLHIKEWIIKGIKDRELRFHEANLQDAILVELLSKGYIFSKEGVVGEKGSNERGRYDFLLQKNGLYYAIETKLIDDENAPAQLKDYIDKIIKKGKIPEEKIRGIIICGIASIETKEKAEKRKYKVLEYKININIPSIIENL
jgi:hypothetical protein